VSKIDSETNQEVPESFKEYLLSVLSENISCLIESDSEITLEVQPSSLLKVLGFLRDDAFCQFKQLTDVCGVDFPDRSPRFDVVYHLLSFSHNRRIRVKVTADEGEWVPSVVKLFSCADWYEREIWDMFGLSFSGHPDLRRILTDYGFAGHPLRKDFPLTGFTEVRYDEEKKRVIYEPVNLPQEYRTFDFMSPWDGAKQLISETDEEVNSGDSADES